MATRKRKTGPSSSQCNETFESISHIVARLKPKLTDLSKKDARPSLLDDLQQIAILGETFTEQRPRGKVSADIPDKLDREGVHLWNVSSLVRQGSECEEDRSLFAALRLAGFRLIEAGLEQKLSADTLINTLQLASKTGSALAECGRNDVSASVLGCAARFEEQLRNTDDSTSGPQEQAKARAVMLYYCSRMLTAWRGGNDAIAQFMLEKITESDERRLSLITSPDREHLAAKILEIGKGIMKSTSRTSERDASGITDAKRAVDAVKWIQKAFALVEKMEDTATPGIPDLKRGILRSLTRAYYLSSSIESENLVRAETTLQELIASIDKTKDNRNPEHLQLRWMRLAVIKKRQAPERDLLEAFTSIIDHTEFSDSEVTDILQELRTLTHHNLVSDILKRCIQRVLDVPAESSAVFVDRFLLSLLSHAAKDQDHNRAIQDIQGGCSYLVSAEYELEKIPAMACLTVLWKVGDRHYQARKWSQAADWFLAGTHEAFATVAQMSGPKCLRKAALCFIEEHEYARASQVIRRCPSGQASTYYLHFLTAVHQGLEEIAVGAIQSMAAAPDFDRKMLLLATQLAHEADMRGVLLAALEALLKTLQKHGPMDAETEAVLLIRCIIRLVIHLMKEAPTEKEQSSLLATLIRHFKTALTLVETAANGKSSPFIAKDVSWLWRTAYNTAVQGCAEWNNAESQIASLFEQCFGLIITYQRVAVGNADADVLNHMVRSSFSCVSARMFELRQIAPESNEAAVLQTKILADIRNVKNAVDLVEEHRATMNQSEIGDFSDILQTTRTFEAEIYCLRQEWDKLLPLIEETGQGTGTLQSYEAIADMLWVEQACPVNVLYAALEALLHSCLDRGSLSVEKFSRWLRAICTILLSRNSQQDRAKAINYVEQALTVLEEQDDSSESSEIYPVDERQWLLSTTYNTGVECLAASYLDEAKRWFEAATVICRSVPDGARHSERISETYRKLLEQYAP